MSTNTPTLFTKPQIQTFLALDKLPNHSGGAGHPLRPGQKSGKSTEMA